MESESCDIVQRLRDEIQMLRTQIDTERDEHLKELEYETEKVQKAMDESEKIKKRTRSYIAASEEIARNLKKEIEQYVTNMFYAITR